MFRPARKWHALRKPNASSTRVIPNIYPEPRRLPSHLLAIQDDRVFVAYVNQACSKNGATKKANAGLLNNALPRQSGPSDHPNAVNAKVATISRSTIAAHVAQRIHRRFLCDVSRGATGGAHPHSVVWVPNQKSPKVTNSADHPASLGSSEVSHCERTKTGLTRAAEIRKRYIARFLFRIANSGTTKGTKNRSVKPSAILRKWGIEDAIALFPGQKETGIRITHGERHQRRTDETKTDPSAAAVPYCEKRPSNKGKTQQTNSYGLDERFVPVWVA